MTTTRPDDRDHMAATLALARRGLGRTWPNPAVGCVVVAPDGRVVGRGWTQPGGRPHAETRALDMAGADARGATAYVSLEPCAHHGVTPPCCDALIAAGIARAVVATGDSDPRTAGQGIARLRAAGVAVTEGVLAEAARDLNAGFFSRLTHGRPLVTLKLATSLDGRIATATGDSQWITGADARAEGHRLRAEHDAILVGINTARADDPDLTCRLPGLADRSPVRVVVDARAELAPDSRLAATADRVPVWLLATAAAPPDRCAALARRGVAIIETAADGAGRVNLDAALTALGGRGLTRLLVEGGGRIAAALLAADRVDRIAWFHAPMVIGGDGRPGVADLALERLAQAPRFAVARTDRCGQDRLIVMRRCTPES